LRATFSPCPGDRNRSGGNFPQRRLTASRWNAQSVRTNPATAGAGASARTDRNRYRDCAGWRPNQGCSAKFEPMEEIALNATGPRLPKAVPKLITLRWLSEPLPLLSNPNGSHIGFSGL
jgi:hypothetical protein